MSFKYFVDSSFFIYLNVVVDQAFIGQLKDFLNACYPSGLATDLLVFDELAFVSKR